MGSSLKISDFCIVQEPTPLDVVDKIEEFHLHPLRMVDACCDFKVMVSANSGYRPRKYELSKGRSGNSQHCFYGKGAVDVTCEDFKENKDKLLEVLIEETEYTRFAIYNTFIHCDYAHQVENRWVFNSRWERIKEV